MKKRVKLLSFFGVVSFVLTSCEMFTIPFGSSSSQNNSVVLDSSSNDAVSSVEPGEASERSGDNSV